MATTLTLTRSEVMTVTTALGRLSGPEDKPFRYSGQTRYSLSKNLRILKRLIEEIDTERVAMIIAHGNGKQVLEQGSEEHAAFVKSWRAYLAETVEVSGVLKFRPDDLQLDQNSIQLDVLADLGPIIEE